MRSSTCQVFGWLDSTVSLHWILGNGQYKQFAVNRVRKISNHCNGDRFRWTRPFQFRRWDCVGDVAGWSQPLARKPGSCQIITTTEVTTRLPSPATWLSASIACTKLGRVASPETHKGGILDIGRPRRSTQLVDKARAHEWLPIASLPFNKNVHWPRWKRTRHSQVSEKDSMTTADISSHWFEVCKKALWVKPYWYNTFMTVCCWRWLSYVKKYGIPTLRELLKTIRATCCGFTATPIARAMPWKLQKNHTIGKEAFEVMGTDFAGPIRYKCFNKRECKCYLVIFSRSLSSAVHL